MLRSKPTTLSIRAAELKDFDVRCRYRKYLRTTGKTTANGKTLVQLTEGPFDDRMMLPRLSSESQQPSSTEVSNLEADTGFIHLGREVARLSINELEQEPGEHRDRDQRLFRGYHEGIERGGLLEVANGDADPDHSVESRGLRVGPVRDPAVVLPPPFSSRPRALMAGPSPTLEADATVPSLDGCSGGSSANGLADDACTDALDSQGHDDLEVTQKSTATSSCRHPHQPGPSRDDDSLVWSEEVCLDGEDMRDYQDGVLASEQLSESHHQNPIESSQAALVSSRTRLACPESTQSNSREQDTESGPPAYRAHGTGKPRTRELRERRC